MAGGALLSLALAGGCGGGGPTASSSGSATPDPVVPPAVAPAAPSGLSALLSPALGANRATLSWTGVSSADSYVVEVGTGSGNSDLGSVVVPATRSSHVVEGLLPRRSYFARVKARSQTATSAASNEVRIESVDLRDVIDALYFGNGPLIPRDGFTSCVSATGSWITYASGASVRLIVSTTTPAAAQQAVERAANQWIDATLGTNSVIVQLTGDPDPRPADNQITIATHPDPVSQGCGVTRGCTFITIRGGLMLAARAIIGPSLADLSAPYAHDAVGHGALGMCHIDGMLIGGARNSLMGGGPSVFSCAPPSDSCIADSLTPLDSSAATAVYASGLPRGASRSAFLGAGLVNQSLGVAPGSASAVRRLRIGPDTERIIIDHR